MMMGWKWGMMMCFEYKLRVQVARWWKERTVFDFFFITWYPFHTKILLLFCFDFNVKFFIFLSFGCDSQNRFDFFFFQSP